MGDFLTILMKVFIYVVPFIILYFIVVAGVRAGINQSEVGRYLTEKRENDSKKKR